MNGRARQLQRFRHARAGGLVRSRRRRRPARRCFCRAGSASTTPPADPSSWLDRPAIPPGVRFNDGKVDRRGRFWAGTMVETEGHSQGATQRACTRSKGAAWRAVTSRTCESATDFASAPTANGFISPIRRRVKSASTIYSSPRVGLDSHVRSRAHRLGAYPDGAAIDADGCLWSAHWGAGCVVRYTPAGHVDRVLQGTDSSTDLCVLRRSRAGRPVHHQRA
jgi:L-arabinonolactonase